MLRPLRSGLHRFIEAVLKRTGPSLAAGVEAGRDGGRRRMRVCAQRRPCASSVATLPNAQGRTGTTAGVPPGVGGEEAR